MAGRSGVRQHGAHLVVVADGVALVVVGVEVQEEAQPYPTFAGWTVRSAAGKT
ncbi:MULTISPECIES: hypothetical protein [Streptomyces]|uniref:hypothetical protein n=1 Tax=Streptomyces TaxID=1883 RepID=UPI0037942F76